MIKMAQRAKVFIYANAFKGEVTLNNFTIIEEELPSLRNGQFLAEAIFISVDPYVRTFILSYPEGTPMVGRQVAK